MVFCRSIYRKLRNDELRGFSKSNKNFTKSSRTSASVLSDEMYTKFIRYLKILHLSSTRRHVLKRFAASTCLIAPDLDIAGTSWSNDFRNIRTVILIFYTISKVLSFRRINTPLKCELQNVALFAASTCLSNANTSESILFTTKYSTGTCCSHHRSSHRNGSLE